MKCCHYEAADEQFDTARAETELARYHRKGPERTTRTLLDLLSKVPIEGASVLDVGGGIGIIGHELLRAGALSATHIEAAEAYSAAARTEASARGHSDRMHFQHGDFVSVYEGVALADIVVLDRVVCCYPDYTSLLAAAASRCRGALALSVPRRRWFVMAFMKWGNLFRRLSHNPFRTFVHPHRGMTSVLQEAGLKPVAERETFVWRMTIYGRG